ncbi:MAG: hypothetical protein CMLOHMNK_00332 [Steroidobacteraceae bacterium]|nr:hypothetical protein [Steroidobacteraceae bacterium]
MHNPTGPLKLRHLLYSNARLDPGASLAQTPRELTQGQLHLMRWRREMAMLVSEIRWTATALDLARTTLARREGRWGFAGGNPRRHEALAVIARRSICRTVADIARELRCSRQAAHRLTTLLAQQGLVHIEPMSPGARVLYVEPSPAGVRALADAEVSAGFCLDEIGAGLQIRDMRKLGAELCGIRQRAAVQRVSALRSAAAAAPGYAGRAAAARSLRSARR